jgi:hypothetical protein
VSVVALALLALGVADAMRTRRWGDPRRARTVGGLCGLGTLILGALLAGVTSGADLGLLLLAAALVCGWTLTAGEGVVRRHGARLPLTVLAAGFAALLLGSGAASPAGGLLQRWLVWSGLPATETVLDADRVLLLAGLLLVQAATGNVIVRLVLIGVGAIRDPGAPQPSDRLRGGRLLGPMERLVILGLGLAGQVTAASLVIAAKGLIRFPELQHSRRDDGVSLEDSLEVYEVTEYFLIGSFVSWLVALAALAVAQLA